MKRLHRKVPNLNSNISKGRFPTLFGGVDRELLTEGIIERCFHTKHFDGRLKSERSILILIDLWKRSNYTGNNKLYKCPFEGDVVRFDKIRVREKTLEMSCPICGDKYKISKKRKVRTKDLMCKDCFSDTKQERRNDRAFKQKMLTQQRLIYNRFKRDIIRKARVRRRIGLSDKKKDN